MKKTLILAVALLFAANLFGQASQTSTTLSAAITDKAALTMKVASATGFAAPSTTSGETYAFVDNELMLVKSVNSTTIGIVRGLHGTRATTHASGAIVYVGPPNYFSFNDRWGSCTAANEIVLPVINTNNGDQFDCRGSYWVKIATGTQTGYNAQVIGAYCTGAMGSAEADFLNNAACSGATATTGARLVTQAGVLHGLEVNMLTAVKASASGVSFTVNKNGSATTLTCTVATNTKTCHDYTHGVTVAAGDIIAFVSGTSNSSETAANIGATVRVY